MSTEDKEKSEPESKPEGTATPENVSTSESVASPENVAPQADEKKEQPPKKRRKWWKIALKILLWILGVVVALLVLALIFRDQLVLFGARTIADYVVTTDVDLREFDTSLSGKVELAKFSVDNVQGYKEKNIVQLGRFYIKIDVASLFTDTIVIDEIIISGFRFNFEQKINNDNNVSDLVQSIKDNLGIVEDDDDEREDEEAAAANNGDTEEGTKKSLLIRRIELTDNAVSTNGVSLPLPNIVLNNIGGEGESLADTLTEAFQDILKECGPAARIIINGVVNVGNSLGASGKVILNGLGDIGGKAVDAMGNVGGKAADVVGNAGSKAVDAMGNVGGKAVDAGGKAVDAVGEAGKKVIDSIKIPWGK